MEHTLWGGCTGPVADGFGPGASGGGNEVEVARLSFKSAEGAVGMHARGSGLPPYDQPGPSCLQQVGPAWTPWLLCWSSGSRGKLLTSGYPLLVAPLAPCDTTLSNVGYNFR